MNAMDTAVKAGHSCRINSLHFGADAQWLMRAPRNPGQCQSPEQPGAAVERQVPGRLRAGGPGADRRNPQIQSGHGLLCGIIPNNPLSHDGSGWGAFEIGGRVSMMDLNNQLGTATGVAGGRQLVYTVALNWYVNRVRFISTSCTAMLPGEFSPTNSTMPDRSSTHSRCGRGWRSDLWHRCRLLTRALCPSVARQGRCAAVRRSAAATLGWIIVGRRGIVISPQTTRNGSVAIDPHTTRGDEAWDHSLACTNDGLLRFGMMPTRGGVRRSIECDQKTCYQKRAHCTFSDHLARS